MTAAQRAPGRVRSSLKRTEFEVAVAAADAYLTLAAAQETVRAAQAGVDRADVSAHHRRAGERRIASRRGRSRAEAELAAARTQLIQAQQAVEVARATLAQFVGIEPAQIALDASHLAAVAAASRTVPAARYRRQSHRGGTERRRRSRRGRRLRALERSYFPRFYLQGAAYARGTGAEINGSNLGGLNGLAPNMQNYALGFTVTFPHRRSARDSRPRSRAIGHHPRADRPASQQIATDLRAQWNRAVATLNGARESPPTRPSKSPPRAPPTEQATARYQSGLGNIDEVAEAQRLLTQAEIDDALARLGVWRGLLGVATAAGDIQPFVAEVAR